MLAANAEFDVGPCLAAFGGGDFDQLADTFDISDTNGSRA